MVCGVADYEHCDEAGPQENTVHSKQRATIEKRATETKYGRSKEDERRACYS